MSERVVRMRLSDGIRFEITEPIEKVIDDIESALDFGGMVSIARPDGHIRFVNPFQILYFEEIERPED
jgi:hypothetical protein